MWWRSARLVSRNIQFIPELLVVWLRFLLTSMLISTAFCWALHVWICLIIFVTNWFWGCGINIPCSCRIQYFQLQAVWDPTSTCWLVLTQYPDSIINYLSCFPLSSSIYAHCPSPDQGCIIQRVCHFLISNWFFHSKHLTQVWTNAGTVAYMIY